MLYLLEGYRRGTPGPGRLTALGIAVLRFDFTGLGHFGGEFANTGFSSNVGDLLAAACWMDSEAFVPQLINGHSLGGAAAIKAAPEIDAARGIVAIRATSDRVHVAHNLGGKIDEMRAQGSAMVDLAGRAFEIRQSFLDDIAGCLARRRSAGPRRDPAGAACPPRPDRWDRQRRAVVRGRQAPQELVSLDRADHLLTREEDANYAAEVIAAWAKHYLSRAEEPNTEAAPDGVVRVSEAEAAGSRQDATIGGRHQLVADEPASVGGTDLGPSS